MKKTLFAMTLVAVFTACGGGSDKKAGSESTSAPAKSDDLSSNPDYQKGLEITAKSDCFTCHKIDEKNIGPAWRDVANKYAGSDTSVNYLAHKIMKGGSGVWGEVPMAPHPNMTEEEAKTVARYVLLLKK